MRRSPTPRPTPWPRRRGLAVTLIPVLDGALHPRKILAEQRNPLNRALIAAYRPAINKVLGFPKTTIALAALALAFTLYP